MTTADHQAVIRHRAAMLTQSATLRVDLVWRADDPHVVEMSIHPADPCTAPAEWEVGRQLLADGMQAPAGDGDIHVRPQIAGPFVEITLFPRQTAEFTLIGRVGELRGFLAATYVHAPLDVVVGIPDAALAAWLEDL